MITTPTKDKHGVALSVGDVCVYVPGREMYESDPDIEDYAGAKVRVRDIRDRREVRIDDDLRTPEGTANGYTWVAWVRSDELVRVTA